MFRFFIQTSFPYFKPAESDGNNYSQGYVW